MLERDLRLSVGRADVQIRAEAMPAHAAKLLQVGEGTPALKVVRLVRGADGSPLQTETATHRGDIFSYRLSLSR